MDGYQTKRLRSIARNTLLACCVAVMLLTSSSLGQIPTTSELKAESIAPSAPLIRSFDQILDRRGNVIFRDTPLAQVVYTLSQQWDINIVAGADVTGTVSGTFRDASLREILDSLLSVNGYGYRVNGNSLLVLKQEQIGPNNPNFRAETMLLPRNISSEAISDLMQALKMFSTPSGGQLQAVPSTNMLMVYDTPDRILQMRGMLQNLTGSQTIPGVNAPGVSSSLGANNLAQPIAAQEDEIITLRPQFIPVAELAKGVELAVGSQANYVSIDNEEALMITGGSDAIRRAYCVMSQIDRPRAQVRITAYIYDVSLGETERLGFDWSQQVFSQGLDSNGIPRNSIRNDAGLLTRAQPSSIIPIATPLGTATTGGGTATATAATGPQYVFRTLTSHFELNTVLQALDETKGAKLLADPHVTVVDRQTANINIVTKIPVQQLTQTQQGGSIGTTAFEEAGIKLSVTPKVASDGTISMQVSPEFSVLTGFNSSGNPIIDARTATTVVRIANQHTLVIGGLRQKTAVETVRGIPGIMNVKYIGALFRSHTTEMRESELIVFLQPEIIDYQTTGLPREQIAVDHQRIQLGRIPTSCLGPGLPDCRDPHCPHHHPRGRPNCGLPDEGLVYPLGLSPQAEGGVCPPDSTNSMQPPTNEQANPEKASVEFKHEQTDPNQIDPHVAPVSLPATDKGASSAFVRPVEELPAVTPASNWASTVNR
jgi:general secretion pathway protein D